MGGCVDERFYAYLGTAPTRSEVVACDSAPAPPRPDAEETPVSHARREQGGRIASAEQTQGLGGSPHPPAGCGKRDAGVSDAISNLRLLEGFPLAGPCEDRAGSMSDLLPWIQPGVAQIDGRHSYRPRQCTTRAFPSILLSPLSICSARCFRLSVSRPGRYIDVAIPLRPFILA